MFQSRFRGPIVTLQWLEGVTQVSNEELGIKLQSGLLSSHRRYVVVRGVGSTDYHIFIDLMS